jgi:thiamine-phosphate pyrophosphorylase
MHINLPKYYYFIDKFNKDEIKNLNNKIAIIYRNYEEKVNIEKITKIRNFLKKKKIKFFLSNDFKTSIRLGLDGVYIPAFNNKIENHKFCKKKQFKIIGSAHNLTEIRTKEKQGVEAIFLSPLFKTKKYTNNLGVVRFNILSSFTKKKIIALGGINKFNIQKLSLLDIHGFASISFFKNTDRLIINKIIAKHRNI